MEEVTVEMVRVEQQGMSLNQVGGSLFVIGFAVVTYFFIPQATVAKDLQWMLLLLNWMLLLIILGLTLLAQLIMPYLEAAILNCIILASGDRKLKPIILKNFEAHGPKNLKASMVFTITLAFLVFTGANFEQIQFFLVSLCKFVAGANITAFKMNSGASDNFQLALDELKISEFLDTQLYDEKRNPGGVVENYAF
mmetsp:Transcript_5577/g.9581  ORF Transcript_5577/g.9581 Transcript_5577/m.9581 type:complete len:195 (-) Transcript_5577:1234-1818(-)